MRKYQYVFLFVFFLGFIPASAQQPYFQQRVDYRINVQLNDVQHILTGNAQYLYTNNSLDTLHEIWFHVWANAYGDRKSVFQQELTHYENLKLWFADSTKTGGIKGLDFSCNGKKLLWDFDPKNPDVCLVKLSDALLPGNSIEIATPFILKIPSNEFSRMGHQGNDYQFTQWYPKPAVYDRNGWNAIPYMDKGEFYSEFGKFTVSITLPSNYIVASTGLCKTASEEMFLDSIASLVADRRENMNAESSKTMKTIVFEQDSIHDFAWFASKNFKVLKSRVRLPNSGRFIELRSFYSPYADSYWKYSINYLRDAILYYSNRVGDYPYPIMSAVYSPNSGGSSMEYPTIINITTSGPAQALDWVIAHEAGHNWFYGILANNERMHPWMDEGINSYYDFCYTHKKDLNYLLMGGDLFRLTKFPFKNAQAFERISVYLMLARNNLDQSCSLPADEYDRDNYTGSVYWKTGFLFKYMESYLGQDKFDEVMKSYFDTWKFKHPEPTDLKNVFETKAPGKFSWFFDTLLATTNKMDFAIQKVKTDTSKKITQVTVKNKTHLEAPFRLSFYNDNQLIRSEWFGPTAKKKYTVGVNLLADKVVLDNDFEMPEINRRRHIYDANKACSYSRPLKLHFGGGFENPEKNELYWIPAAGWNYYDKWMLGLALYNAFPITRKDEFLLMPLFSISNQRLEGVLNYQHHFKPSFAQDFTLGGLVKRFAYAQTPEIFNYTLIKPKADLLFRKSKNRYIDKNLKLEYVLLLKSQSHYAKNGQDYSFLTLTYLYQNKRLLHPYSYQGKIESNVDFIKASAEFAHTFHFNQKKIFNIRFFGGAFLTQAKGYYGNYNFRMSGLSGYQDYTMSDWYFGRTESSGIASHQMSHGDGDFKMATIVGQSNKWLVSMNAETNLPGLIPFKLYFDIGTYYQAKTAFNGSQQFPWNIGLKQGFFKDAIEIFVPLAFSSDLKQVSDLKDEKFIERIRFCFNLDKMNFVKQIKKGGFF